VECHFHARVKAGISATLSGSVIEMRISFESADLLAFLLSALLDFGF
jgi:hypothetical protein